jgi:hypothetical protein
MNCRSTTVYNLFCLKEKSFKLRSSLEKERMD